MSVDFKYVPINGPLSGRAFEEQTERAFNELGANMDGMQQTAAQAVDIARGRDSAASGLVLPAFAGNLSTKIVTQDVVFRG